MINEISIFSLRLLFKLVHWESCCKKSSFTSIIGHAFSSFFSILLLSILPAVLYQGAGLNQKSSLKNKQTKKKTHKTNPKTNQKKISHRHYCRHQGEDEGAGILARGEGYLLVAAHFEIYLMWS